MDSETFLEAGVHAVQQQQQQQQNARFADDQQVFDTVKLSSIADLVQSSQSIAKDFKARLFVRMLCKASPGFSGSAP